MATLEPKSFLLPVHRDIFESVVGLGAAADYLTVYNDLEKRKKQMGPPGYLASLMEGVPFLTADQAQGYCEIIQNGLIRRHINAISARLAANTEADPDLLLEKTEKYLHVVRSQGKKKRKTAWTALELVKHEMDEAVKGGAPEGIHFGLPSIDELVPLGMELGSFWILAARPQVGKSSFMLGLILRNLKAGKKVCHFALEMGPRRNVWRMLAQQTGLALSRVKSPLECKVPLTPEEQRRYSKALEELSGYGLYMVAQPRISPPEIENYAKQAQTAMGGLDLVTIDYFQLVRSPQKLSSLREQAAETVWELDALAQRLGVPVLLAAQLNRRAEGLGEDDLPTLADLKETGTLEEKGTGVLLLHRWDVNKRNGPPVQDAKIILAKNQDGPTGMLRMAFRKNTMEWLEQQDYGTEVADGQEG
jgi:replicative DNA helicase